MTKSKAQSIAGTLSEPSKMPGYATGTPAAACITGSKLARNPNSPCHDCYAKKGFYALYPSVAVAQARRLAGLTDPGWVEAMVKLIGGTNTPWFRWHDSGDLQSYEHLLSIVEVCRQLNHVAFWLPTREYAFVRQYLRDRGSFPSNLTVRVSAALYDAPAPQMGLPTSQVHTGHEAPADTYSCPARHQGNSCGSCRACWDSSVETVSYPKH